MHREPGSAPSLAWSDMKKCGFETVESEIRKEKAEALGRAGERLERALSELEACRQKFFVLLAAAGESVRDGEERFSRVVEDNLAEYFRLCEQARELRHWLIVQREAVGLWRHEDVERQYPLPLPLKLPMATRPEGHL